MQYSIRTSLLLKLLMYLALSVAVLLASMFFITHERIKYHIATEITLNATNVQTPSDVRALHSKLEKQIYLNLSSLAFFLLIVTAILIWFAVKKELAIIEQIIKAIKHRAPNDLRPITLDYVPSEIKPIIEELNNLFLKLQDAFLREERFASDAAHELRTPLAALRVHVHVALHADSDKDRDHALRRIDEGIERCTHVINQLSILSRTARQIPDTKFEQVKISNEAKKIIAELFPLIKKNKINIELSGTKPEKIILGNPTAIGILIRNLIDNAVRYSPRNSAVKVVIENDAKHVVLKVIDNGPGIPENMREQVFERFFRIADSSIQGSGLGLSIVQQIVKKHHAEIKLATPKSGEGLEVDVIFRRFK